MRLRDFFVGVGMVAAVAGLPGAAGAVTMGSPMARVTVAPLGNPSDSATIQLGAGFVPGSNTQVYYGAAPGMQQSFQAVGSTSNNTLATGTSLGSGNTDPFILFSVSVIDTTATGDFFNFLYTIPLVPPLLDGVPVGLLSTLGITITASSPSGGSISSHLFPNIVATNVGNCAAGVDIGTGFSAPGFSTSTKNFSQTGTYSAIPGCDSTLALEISFAGSGNDTSYALTGLFETVPEPASLGLFGFALSGLVAARRRRR